MSEATPEPYDKFKAKAKQLSRTITDGEKNVKIDELVGLTGEVFNEAYSTVGDRLSGYKGVVQGAASEFGERLHQVREAGSELAEVMPSKTAVIEAVANAETPGLPASWLFGLFVPPPQWPAKRYTVAGYVQRFWLPIAILASLGTVALAVGGLLFLVTPFIVSLLAVLLGCCLPLFVPLALYLRHAHAETSKAAKAHEADAEAEAEAARDWREQPSAFFGVDTKAARTRRPVQARAIISDVASRAVHTHETKFNDAVRSATGLALYGCGVVASTHVGALRALERHGLRYDKIRTLAGVSSGSVVAAMLAVGCNAEAILEQVKKLDFQALVRPELGSLIRTTSNGLISTMGLDGWGLLRLFERGRGPGVNSGRVLEESVGRALAEECGDANITLQEVLRNYGKRLVLIAAELDTGKERRLTPETDPHLPVRVAVRMSMGIPGIFEPFQYNGHVYCDGGMINDFPMVALGEDLDKGIGLCVKQRGYVLYNMGKEAQLEGTPGVPSATVRALEQLRDDQRQMNEAGPNPTRELVDYVTTCVNIMMDANLDLQIEAARRQMRAAEPLEAPHDDDDDEEEEDEPHSPLVVSRALSRAQRGTCFELAPKVMTLCSGMYQPFDFGLSRGDHEELYLGGQLFLHFYAAKVGEREGPPAPRASGGRYVLSGEQKAQALLFVMGLDKPK